jgi:hypothetical protein
MTTDEEKLLLNPLAIPVDGGFRDDNWCIWCGSGIRGEDGRYHLFASRWSKRTAFSANWLTNSEIVRAVADRPEGPYHFQEIVLPARGAGFWDGLMTHNPTIHVHDGRYLLFYVGTTFDGPVPESGQLTHDDPRRVQARANQRIGLAIADDPAGPWTRFDEPVLQPADNGWDRLMVTNPAPVIHDDGSVLLYYKSTNDDRSPLAYGLARTERPEGPYERVLDEPIFGGGENRPSYEDAYVWQTDSGYHMIFNDLRGAFTGEDHAGGYAVSSDGLAWQVSGKAYSRTVCWNDGTTTRQGSLERPQLLIEDGRPSHLFAATADGPGGFSRAEHTWNVAIPLGN